MDLKDKINKLKLQAQTTPLGSTCDTRLLFEILDEVEQCSNANPSEELKYINNKIADLEDDLQHYTMVEHDKCKEFYIREDLKQFKEILECLQNLKTLEDTKSSNASIDVATKMLLDRLEMLSDCAVAMQELPRSNWTEYAENAAELDLKLHFAYLDIKQALIKAQEQEKVLKIIKEKNVDIILLKNCNTVEEYNDELTLLHISKHLTQEEFNSIMEMLKNE